MLVCHGLRIERTLRYDTRWWCRFGFGWTLAACCADHVLSVDANNECVCRARLVLLLSCVMLDYAVYVYVLRLFLLTCHLLCAFAARFFALRGAWGGGQQILCAQSMEGENLRPDLAQAMEDMGAEAK